MVNHHSTRSAAAELIGKAGRPRFRGLLWAWVQEARLVVSRGSGEFAGVRELEPKRRSVFTLAESLRQAERGATVGCNPDLHSIVASQSALLTPTSPNADERRRRIAA